MATSSSELTTSEPLPSLSKADLPYVLPRVAIAVVFLGFGVWELFSPQYWSAYVPALLSGHAWTLRVVQFHGLVLTTTAVALLLPRYSRYAAGAATFLLAEICLDIVVSNGVTGVLVRDVGLLVVAVALCWLPYASEGAATRASG